MKVHFREQYGSRGEEILYVTPAGTSANSGASEFLKRSITWPYAEPGIYWPAIRMLRTAALIQWHLFFISSFFFFSFFFCHRSRHDCKSTIEKVGGEWPANYQGKFRTVSLVPENILTTRLSGQCQWGLYLLSIVGHASSILQYN